MNLNDLFRLDNIVYIIVTIVVVILTTIKQFNKQEIKNKLSNKKILDNLSKIEKTNIKILNLIDMHSQDIKQVKKEINVLEHRVSRLEDSHVNLYTKIGGNKNNDNTWYSATYLAYSGDTFIYYIKN